MTSQLPEGAADRSAWLGQASDEQLGRVLADQAATEPGLLVELADALERAEKSRSWDVELFLGETLDNEGRRGPMTHRRC